jgi:hypothetical protein
MIFARLLLLLETAFKESLPILAAAQGQI